MVTSDRTAAVATLRRVGRQSDDAIDLAEAALALASLDRPRVDLERYSHHLALLARDVAEAARRHAAEARDLAALPAEDRAAALNHVILEKYGYAGDHLTYDDLQNANLMRVIDRRKGLPVTLGILFIHAARAQGWEADGLSFPGHFLIRLDGAGRRVILDPFNEGRLCDTPELRHLLKTLAGMEAELEPAHYAPAGNRAVLLRLQNNIKLRLVRGERYKRALEVVENMLLIAPNESGLWREAAVLNARLGNLGTAIDRLEGCLEREPQERTRHAIATLLQRLKGRLH
jgi:regulator of sirC expression with transglutaminase-like and TPR domain